MVRIKTCISCFHGALAREGNTIKIIQVSINYIDAMRDKSIGVWFNKNLYLRGMDLVWKALQRK